MHPSASSQITALLNRMEGKDRASHDRLFELVYGELHRLARGKMAGEGPAHTLQPTALVHEAYLKLVDQSRVDWRGRTHFFAIGAMVMRRILTDHARQKQRQKRGGGWERVTLDRAVAPGGQPDFDALALHRALEGLAEVDPRGAQVVELRFFAGLKIQEIAEHLGVSKRTVEGDWTHAKAWLRLRLSQDPGR